MLQFLYIVAFTILALLAMANLIRNLLTLGIEAQRNYGQPRSPMPSVSHPELLDSHGDVIDEPLLVMRSLSVDDARAQLDALYDESPGYGDESRGEV
ncbi:DUF2973 domain-containing protein [Candidatus Synechococcus calcipolaris G9]|uniref:DUF2973 domain-containing protein n=2 Tax=Synechococcus TaxID=1129 RepID=A0ABT6F069_9SYNE|nr:DUF2973 domain-containing protein [Candidatus Synechococcus calcipolaris]MDG2991220.1 DUF2973 domain-containing protein [Candidatus Synechococcus calcipolaris G9]